MTRSIVDIYNSLQEIAWHFGSHGVNGACCEDLSFVEYMALKSIHENNDCSVQSIGLKLNFTKSGATRITNRLEVKGYVVRQNSSVDGRICCVSITDKGTQAILQIAENYISYLEEVLKDLEPLVVEHIGNSMDILLMAVVKGKPFTLTSQLGGDTL